jgi:hypothetical protein
MKNHEFDAQLPGESFEDFLRRHRAHPDQKDRRAATPQEEKESDVTRERIKRGDAIGGWLTSRSR